MIQDRRIYLASASPRRKELLTNLGIPLEVIRADINEDPLPGEAPIAYTERLAREKAESGWAHVLQFGLPLRPLLAADTTVVLGDRIIGKPVDEADAAAILRQLSGTEHQVVTSVAMRDAERLELKTSVSHVRFRKLSEAEISNYVHSREPMDKAGAYGIQGLAGIFVEEIRGSFTGIVGLPLCETAALLADFGHPVL
ncbi:septum formation protein [Chitinivorax tropicus]|uniref:dTTP/UTP pyrophosphatase n=1 Tax=Chitinivorax tropicus TaxID=714531 RepID=A0A840MT50_9PROT|nr:Maf family protein [Chitinivorax tropicus]MBB5018391.1 septum formation protein [Chitinivorax tropicus]